MADPSITVTGVTGGFVGTATVAGIVHGGIGNTFRENMADPIIGVMGATYGTMETANTATIVHGGMGNTFRDTGNMEVNVTGNTGHAGTSNAAGINYGGMGNRNIYKYGNKQNWKHLLARTKNEIKLMTKNKIRVSAVDDVITMMKQGQDWISITANPGDGKTTLGFLLLKEFLQKKISVFTVENPGEYDLIQSFTKPRVIMLDARCGQFFADQHSIDSWYDVLQKISRLCKDDKNFKVIFINRKNVANECLNILGPLAHEIFNGTSSFDLSKKKLTDERRKIIENHIGRDNWSFDPATITTVCNMDFQHGFPSCCMIFSRLISQGLDVSMIEFFNSPLEFLDMTTRVLYNGNCQDLFELMIKHGGQLNFLDIDDKALRKVVKNLEGSYITVSRNGICQFAYSAVYESVLNVINAINPLYCVQHATLSVIRQKMIISTSEEEDSNRSPCYIIVKPFPAVMKALAERFLDEIHKGDDSVLPHRFYKSTEFCEALNSLTDGEKPCRTEMSLEEKRSSDIEEDEVLLNFGDEKTTFKVLSGLASSVETGKKNDVNVTREDVLPGAMRAFKRRSLKSLKSFNPRHILRVRFAGEQDIDNGGPTREFLRLLMARISDYPIFTGPSRQRMLTMDYKEFQAGNYEVIGRMIAYCLVHRGPAPHFFSNLLVNLLTMEDTKLKLDIQDIQDEEQRELVARLSSAATDAEFSYVLQNADNIIEMAGCRKLALFHQKTILCQALTYFLVVERLQEYLDQFRNGLETLGVLGALERHPCLRECFLPTQMELDTDMIETIFTLPDLAEPRSERRRSEELAITYWRDFLLDVQEDTERISLRDILIFGTGADSVPFLGLDPQPRLQFKEPSPNMEDSSHFPTANTCRNIITIPMMSDYDRFRQNMNAAIGVRLFTDH